MQNNEFWKKKLSKEAVLSPIDRSSEVLFGLIMVLTFTGAISVSSDGKEEIRSLLWAALGCNVAWGLVDAIMYLMNVMFERGYSRRMFIKLRSLSQDSDTIQLLRDELQPAISELMDDEQIRQLDIKLRTMPEAPPVRMLLSAKDFYTAFKIFMLVFLCTLPVSLPFGIVHEPLLALRISNGVALLMLFLGGYNLAVHAGFNPWLTGFVYTLIGVILVAVTIALGG
jgi:hypothetical protein